MANLAKQSRAWNRSTPEGDFMISTAKDLLDLEYINQAFASPEMYWAKPLSLDDMRVMVSNSLNFGVYKIKPAVPQPKSEDSPSSPRTPSPTLEGEAKHQLEQVGFARLMTDYVTTAYLTDVYVSPDHRKLGLGIWLMACCKEAMEAHSAFRRGFLMASPDVGEKFYSRELGFWDIREEAHHAVCMTRRAFELDGHH